MGARLEFTWTFPCVHQLLNLKWLVFQFEEHTPHSIGSGGKKEKKIEKGVRGKMLVGSGKWGKG